MLPNQRFKKQEKPIVKTAPVKYDTNSVYIKEILPNKKLVDKKEIIDRDFQ